MTRLGEYSVNKAADDYGISRQIAQHQHRVEQTEAANTTIEKLLQKIQDASSKKSKAGGGWGEKLLKGIIFGAMGPAGGAMQLLDSIYTGLKTDADYKKYIDKVKNLAEIDPEIMKQFEGTPLETILANTIGGAATSGKNYLQGVRDVEKTGNIFDTILSGLSLGQGIKASKVAKATPAFDVAPPLAGNTANLLPYAPKNINWLDKALHTGTDAFSGLVPGGKAGLDAAKFLTTPINIGDKFSFNPYSLLRAGKRPMIDMMLGEPGDIQFNEISAPKRRIR
jgi:hypothetical protein